MKKCCLIILIVCSACSTYASYNWQQLTSMPSNGRVGASGFTVNNKLYYGFGDYDYSIQYKDLWEYDPATDTWAQKADLPGVARVSSTSFSINGFGYVGLGWTSYIGATTLGDFYKYDPAGNTWTTIATFPGNGRFNASSFVINGYAYVGIGASPQQSMYRYNPVNNSWQQMASFPGAAVQSTSSFTVNDLGFICGGWDGNAMTNELWAYDPLTNSWAQKTSAPVPRISAIAFVIDDLAFVGTGGTGNFGGTQDMYQYDYLSDSWTLTTAFPGLPLNGFRGLSIGNTAYGFGGGDAGIGYYSSELWKFAAATGIKENTEHNVRVYFNMVNQTLQIALDKTGRALTIQLFSINGQKILSDSFNETLFSIDLKDFNLTAGSYIYSINDGEKIISSGKLLIQ
jgi:N-acetylneuraminic acid mutarotase